MSVLLIILAVFAVLALAAVLVVRSIRSGGWLGRKISRRAARSDLFMQAAEEMMARIQENPEILTRVAGRDPQAQAVASLLTGMTADERAALMRHTAQEIEQAGGAEQALAALSDDPRVNAPREQG